MAKFVGDRTRSKEGPRHVTGRGLFTDDFQLPGMLQATTIGSGYGITVRSVEDDDCVGMPGMPDFPCPAVVVGALLTGETVDTHIEALTEEQ